MASNTSQVTGKSAPKKNPVSPARRRRRRAVLAVGLGLLFGSGGGFGVAMFSGLPAIQGLESYEPTAATRIFDRNGDEIAAIFVERRIPVSIDDIPPELRNAIVAVEDKTFYQHHGVDALGIVRAVLSNLRKGRAAQGGSTITQQLAKNLFLTPDKTLRRKLKEAYIAFQIERRYTKDQILQLYLNQIPLGNGAFGVEAAAQTYFGKSAKELDLIECATIAGLPKAPSYYNPVKHPERARQRRNVVLLRMRDEGLISQAEFQRYKDEPLALVARGRRNNAAPYFVDYLLPQLEQRFGEQRVWRGGLQVYTTLDLKLQEAAEKSLSAGIARARKRQDGWEKRVGRDYPPVEGALLALEPNTGDILAMVGGSSYAETQFNRTVQAKRQPGSSFKPLLYAAAINAGYSQSDLLWDAPIKYTNRTTGRVWAPKNWYHDPEFLGHIPMRIALEQSSNCASIYLLERLGLPTTVRDAKRLGITTPLQSNLTLALGSSEVTLLDLTRAYAAFANGGVQTEPRAIVRVYERRGGLIWEAPPSHGSAALRPEVAYVVTDMLRGYTQTGLAKSAGARLPFEVAGKTGTTDNSVDAWFVGFSSRVVASVWMGIDVRKPMPVVGSLSGPLPVWIDFMEVAGQRYVPTEFVPPPNVTFADVDRRTGRLLQSSCADAEEDTWAYIKGTEPTESCADTPTTALPFGFHLQTDNRFE